MDWDVRRRSRICLGLGASGVLLALGSSTGIRAASKPEVAPAGLRFEVKFLDTIGTAISHENDKVEVRVVKPVMAGNRQVFPTEAVFSGQVTMVRRGNPDVALPALKVQFDKPILPDGRTFRTRASLVEVKFHPNTQEVAVRAGGLIEPEDAEERASEYLDSQRTYGASTPGSLGAAIGAVILKGLAKGSVAGLVYLHQFKDFTIQKGQQAKLMLDSDLMLANGSEVSPARDLRTPTSGHIFGNAYRNDYFGFVYPFPEGWHVQSPESQKEVAIRGHAAAFGKGKLPRPADWTGEHRMAMARTSFLFGATQAAGSEMTPPSVQIIAFDFSGTEAVTRTAALLGELGQGLELKGAVETQSVTSKYFAGRQFALAQYKFEVEGAEKTPQVWYEDVALTRVYNDFLIWFFAGDDQVEADKLRETLNELSFNPGFEDEGVFVMYGRLRNIFTELWPGLNDAFGVKYNHVLSTLNFKVSSDGSYESRSTCENDEATAKIASDGRGNWTKIEMTERPLRKSSESLPSVEVDYVRQGREVRGTRSEHGKTKPAEEIKLDEGEVPLPLNLSDECSYDASLLSPFVRLYDEAKGGEQRFQFFSVWDGGSPFFTLEAMGDTRRRVGNQDEHMTWYKYSFAGSAISFLADDNGRIIMGEVPDYPFRDIFVRKGYQSLLEDPYVMALLSAP